MKESVLISKDTQHNNIKINIESNIHNHSHCNINVNNINVDDLDENNINQDVECPICYDIIDLRQTENINEKSPIKLDCQHVFHYGCILATFKTNLNNNRKTRRCPFCREVTSHIPLGKYMFPIRNIHSEYELIKKYLHRGDFQAIYELSKKYNFLNTNKCHAIVTTGNNRGTQCKKTKKDGFDFCFIHYKKFSIYNTLN